MLKKTEYLCAILQEARFKIVHFGILVDMGFILGRTLVVH